MSDVCGVVDVAVAAVVGVYWPGVDEYVVLCTKSPAAILK